MVNLVVVELINLLCYVFILVYLEKESWIFGEVMCIFDEFFFGVKYVCDYKFFGYNCFILL